MHLATGTAVLDNHNLLPSRWAVVCGTADSRCCAGARSSVSASSPHCQHDRGTHPAGLELRCASYICIPYDERLCFPSSHVPRVLKGVSRKCLVVQYVFHLEFSSDAAAASADEQLHLLDLVAQGLEKLL